MVLKPVRWVASSKQDLSVLPDAVRSDIGQAIYVAQRGDRHDDAKVLKGFSGAGVLEVIARRHGDTFRAVYTVRFANAVYVLHVFQKKSKSGIATAKRDMDLVKSRLKLAEDDYMRWTSAGGSI